MGMAYSQQYVALIMRQLDQRTDVEHSSIMRNWCRWRAAQPELWQHRTGSLVIVLGTDGYGSAIGYRIAGPWWVFLTLHELMREWEPVEMVLTA